MGNNSGDAIGIKKLEENLSTLLAFDADTGAKSKIDLRDKAGLEKYNLASNKCDKLKKYQSYNLQFAFDILHEYHDNGEKNANEDLPVYQILNEVIEKAFEYYQSCQVEFEKMSQGWGYWDGKRIVLNQELDTYPFAIASLLIHEGYHAKMGRSHDSLFDDEIITKFTELGFYREVQVWADSFLKDRFYSTKSNQFKKLAHKRIFYPNGYKLDIEGVNKLHNRNKLIDKLVSNYYSKRLVNLTWIKGNWNKYGGILIRETRTLHCYFQEYVRNQYLEDDEYEALVDMLYILTAKPPQEVFIPYSLKNDVRQKIINQANTGGEKEKAILKWISPD